MKIEAGQTYTVGSNLLIPNEKVEIYGKLVFDPTKSAKITCKDIINYGEIQMRPASVSIIHEIEIAGVDETKFIGSGMDHLDSDPGLWCMGKGILNLQGFNRKRFTNATGSVNAGATSFSVKDATGWQVGDEIVINPTTDQPKPGGEGVQVNDSTGVLTDEFMDRLERRKIASINGNTISFTTPLKYNHAALTAKPNKLAPQGRFYTAHIQNLTSNVKIHGTANGKAHIFCCSHSKNPDGSTAHNHQKQWIDQAEIYWMGPRKFQGHHRNIKQVITGRYVMHFHHGGEGARGSMVSNSSFHDNDSRCFVPHLSNGVTFKGNSVHNNLGQMGWWDVSELSNGEMSHDIDYDGNLGTGIKWDKVEGCVSFELGIGDNCKCRNNWIVYGNAGDENGSGAYQWRTNNESVWLFLNNGANSCNNPLWTWQNSGRPHSIKDAQVFCCYRGVSHGAYGNPYIYSQCEFYQAPIHHKAAASLAGGSSFERCVFDGMNKIPWLVNKETSAAGASFANQYRECEFIDASVAMRMDNFPANSQFAVPVDVEMANCVFRGIQKKVEFFVSSPDTTYGQLNVSAKIQNGNVAERHTKNGVTSIPKFAPDKYGTGDGLKAEYYKGMNFETKVLEIVESMVRHDMWRVEKPIYPQGVHHDLNTGPFSVRWTGSHEPWFSGNWRFKLQGSSGYRMWYNNQLVIDSPGNKGDNTDNAVSNAINLTAFTKYPIKIELYDPGDEKKGIELYWKHDSMKDFEDVPMSQLYSGVGPTPPPPPQVFKSVRKTKDFTRNNCPAGQTGEVYTYAVDAGQFESTISQADADGKADADIAAKGQNQANQFGTCKIIIMPGPCETFVEADYLAFPQNEDVAKAVKAGRFKTGYDHWISDGKKEGRPINRLCPATPMPGDVPPAPGKTLKSTIKVYSDGTIEVV